MAPADRRQVPLSDVFSGLSDIDVGITETDVTSLETEMTLKNSTTLAEFRRFIPIYSRRTALTPAQLKQLAAEFQTRFDIYRSIKVYSALPPAANATLLFELPPCLLRTKANYQMDRSTVNALEQLASAFPASGNNPLDTKIDLAVLSMRKALADIVDDASVDEANRCLAKINGVDNKELVDDAGIESFIC